MGRYRILIVDDEVIILSGIKHILQWEEENAEVVGTARNGEEALSLIGTLSPDIVISDLKMPTMDGLELLKRTAKEHPEIVFIILTNLEEFRLAKEAIRYNAIEYLLKTELDEDTIRSALRKAEEESDKRKTAIEAAVSDALDEKRGERMIASLLQMRSIPRRALSEIGRDGTLSSYAILSILIAYPAPTLAKDWKNEDYEKLFEWEGDIIGKILPTYLGRTFRIEPLSTKGNGFIYLIPDINEETWSGVLSRITGRIENASRMVTGLETTVLSTAVHHGEEELLEARSEYEDMEDAYYMEKEHPEYTSLSLDEVFPKIERDVRKHDAASIKAALSRVMESIGSNDHRKSQMLFAISAIEAAARSGSGKPNAETEALFGRLRFISRRSEALSLLQDITEALQGSAEAMGKGRSEAIERAREYILSNTEKEIRLKDVAAAAYVSPGYMSALWNRTMGSSLVDFINEAKVERSKELMAGGMYRISDIALKLGYENIYYFSKVFKKVTGETPTGYLKRTYGISER